MARCWHIQTGPHSCFLSMQLIFQPAATSIGEHGEKNQTVTGMGPQRHQHLLAIGTSLVFVCRTTAFILSASAIYVRQHFDILPSVTSNASSHQLAYQPLCDNHRATDDLLFVQHLPSSNIQIGIADLILVSHLFLFALLFQRS